MIPRTARRRAFVALAALVFVLLPVLSLDFGVTEDEPLHHHHGQSILDYFLGRSDAALRSPLDGDGRLTFAYDRQSRDLTGALNIYGGVFDLLCAATHRLGSPLGEFEHRHVVNSLFGGLLVLFVGLTARAVAGWRAGVLALLMAALSPRVVAHSMNNPVDLPFAALYAAAVYFMLRLVERLPSFPARRWLPLLIVIPLATGVRIAGLVLIAYLLLFVGLWCGAQLVAGRPGARATAAGTLGRTGLLAAAAYLLVSAPWPLAHRDPLTTPLLAFRHLTRLETFNALDLFEGRWIDRWDIPWYFVLKWLVIGTPLFVPLGLLLSPLACRAPRGGAGHASPVDRRQLALVAFTCLFPIAFVIVRGSNVYNDARHVLFAYPPLLVACAVAFESALRRAGRPALRAVVTLSLAASLVEPLAFMIRNHPHQGVYFSPLVGGVRGAWGRYETDFWGNSVRAAVEWIVEHAEPLEGRPVRVRLWYGEQGKAGYYLRGRPGFELVAAGLHSDAWDYQIWTAVECKFAPEWLEHWPPNGTVHEIKADGVPLSAVLINYRNRSAEEVLRPMRAWAERDGSHATYVGLGRMLEWLGRDDEALAAYRRAAELPPSPVGARPETHLAHSDDLFAAGRYEASIALARMALRREPRSTRAWARICAAQAALGRRAQARTACEATLALDPGHEQARADLRRVAEATTPDADPGPGPVTGR
jgi:hypothetical protein